MEEDEEGTRVHTYFCAEYAINIGSVSSLKADTI